MTPRGFQQITSATLASATALTVPKGGDGNKPDFAVINADTQVVRYRDDGTDPTAAIGMRLLPGDQLIVQGGQLSAIRFIYETAGANLNVSYYRNA